MKDKKVILHLCADIGSDSYPYQEDDNYAVLCIGKDYGIENYHPEKHYYYENIHGIIANPVCTEFSIASGYHKKTKPNMELVKHCQRIISICNPFWWVIENPYSGTLKDYIGMPNYKYEPWNYGSPWTKKTALWGSFNIPKKIYTNWEEVPKNKKLYIRPGRKKPSLAFLHKSAIYDIPEFAPFIDKIDSDNAFRSLCSQGFAKAFKEANP